MKNLIVLALVNGILAYGLWGEWQMLFMLSGAFFYAYKRFLIEYADRMLK